MFININSQVPEFKCNACGACCSHIRGMTPKEDKEFIEEYAFGRMPVIQLVPPEQMTFPLWDWEAKRFMEWQHEANVNAGIRPLRAILDLNLNKAIILNYFMDAETDACPFLKNSKCSIYHTKRAYVCRLFPFNRSPFSSQRLESMFGQCGAMDHIVPKVPADFEKMMVFLNKAFPDGSFLNAVQNDIIIEWSNKIIIDLMKRKIIRPAMNYPYGFLLKRIDNAKRIDFTDFLVECGYFTKTQKEDLIKNFDNNADAKEKVKPYIVL